MNETQIAKCSDLGKLEAIVDRGRATFVEVGLALSRIREAQLYKQTHQNWGHYMRDRWGWSRQRAGQLISAAEVGSARVDLVIPTERHAREIARLPTEEWSDALEEAATEGGTVQALQQVVERRRPRKKKSPSIQQRRTPQWLFDALNDRFGPFELDAFAEPHNALCPKFYTREQDGCSRPWLDVTFGNPEFEDMVSPLEQALRQAESGIVRSIILGPVGCSQDWYHRIAIRGTIYVPDIRISYDLPDGTPDPGADRDTIIMGFGREHANKQWQKGIFRAHELKLKHLAKA